MRDSGSTKFVKFVRRLKEADGHNRKNIHPRNHLINASCLGVTDVLCLGMKNSRYSRKKKLGPYTVHVKQ